MALFGSLGKFLGKGLKGVSKVAGIIPGVGSLAGGAMGGLGELLEKGSKTNLKGLLGSSAGGVLGGLLGGIGGGAAGGGGTLGKLGSLLGLGLGGAQVYGDYKQSKKDSKYARALADEALENYRQARTMAQDNWAAKSPLRAAFNFGAFQMADPTNPFSRGSMFSQFAPMMQQQPQATDHVPGQLGGLLGFNPGMGGRTPGTPTMRSRSVKGGMVNEAQDRGRDRMDTDEKMRAF